MSSFAVAALASGCFLQQPITPAMNVEVVPVSRPFAFRDETEFALRMASELVATVDQNLVRFRILCRVTTKATLRPYGACEKTSN